MVHDHFSQASLAGVPAATDLLFSGKLRGALLHEGVSIKLHDGSLQWVRPLRPSDAPQLQEAWASLTDQERWMRVLHAMPRLSEPLAQKLAHPNPDDDCAVTAPAMEGNPFGHATGELLGGARIVGDRLTGHAEFAVTLLHDMHGHGLAKGMLEIVTAAAFEMGYGQVWGMISPENQDMLGLARRLGFAIRPCREDASLKEAVMRKADWEVRG